jgi:hypothetical protein
MSRNAQRITVYDVVGAATDEGEWIDGEFLAVVTNAKPAQGRKNSEAELCDPDSPNIKTKAVYFGGDFTRFEGATCLFHGQGMKAKIYRGKCELQIGEKTLVNVATAAPAGAPKPAAADQPKHPAPAATLKPEEAANRFHKLMKKTALLWLHAEQYVCDIEAKLPSHRKLTPDLRQSAISSMFITAKDHGLLEIAPALRPVDDGCNPKPYVPVAPAAPDPAAVAAAAAAAAAEAAAKAAAAAQAQHLDEDVPF